MFIGTLVLLEVKIQHATILGLNLMGEVKENLNAAVWDL